MKVIVMRFGFLGLVAFWVISVMGGRGFGVERPFVLWDEADIAGIREKIETEDWAKAAYEKLLSEADGNERQFAGLLRYALTGDEELGEREKKELMRMVRSAIPRGGAQYINVIRYDMLYDLLTEEEREEIKECFEIYIENAIFPCVLL